MSTRGKHPHCRLTDLMVGQAGPGRHADGNGLYLFVDPNRTRRWIQRLVISGRRRDLGLGGYPLVLLVDARRKALENRRVARSGGDPTQVVPQQIVPTLRSVVDDVIAARRAAWRGPGTEQKWRRLFNKQVFPEIGDQLVSEVTLEDLRRILVPLWAGRGSIGYTLRQHLARVMDWSVAHNYRKENPANVVESLLPKMQAVVTHYPSLPYRRVADAMAAVQASDAPDELKLLLLFMVLCASRLGEATKAVWSEIDLDNQLWTIPGERMKAKVEHKVPVSVQAIEVLERARALERPGPLVFAALTARGRVCAVSRQQIRHLLAQLGLVDDRGRTVVPHGFRSTFAMWTGEEEKATREVREAALAHAETNKTVASYVRTDFLAVRRPLMQEWADYVLPRQGKLMVARSLVRFVGSSLGSVERLAGVPPLPHAARRRLTHWSHVPSHKTGVKPVPHPISVGGFRPIGAVL